MTDANPIIENLLKKIDVAVSYQYPKKFNELPCISYFEMSNMQGMGYDNVEQTQISTFSIDVWGRTPKETNEIGIKINDILQSEGWTRGFACDVVPQEGHKIYHRAMRFKKHIFEEEYL